MGEVGARKSKEVIQGKEQLQYRGIGFPASPEEIKYLSINY